MSHRPFTFQAELSIYFLFYLFLVFYLLLSFFFYAVTMLAHLLFPAVVSCNAKGVEQMKKFFKKQKNF